MKHIKRKRFTESVSDIDEQAPSRSTVRERGRVKPKRLLFIIAGAAVLLAVVIFILDRIPFNSGDFSGAPVVYGKDSRIYVKGAYANPVTYGIIDDEPNTASYNKLVSFINQENGLLTLIKNGTSVHELDEPLSDKTEFSADGRYMLYRAGDNRLILYDTVTSNEKASIVNVYSDEFGFGESSKSFYYIEGTAGNTTLYVYKLSGGSRRIDTNIDKVSAFTENGTVYYCKGGSLYISNARTEKTTLVISGETECFICGDSDAEYVTCDGALYYVTDSGDKTPIERENVAAVNACDTTKKIVVYMTRRQEDNLYSVYMSRSNESYYICDADTLDNPPVWVTSDMKYAVYRDAAERTLYLRNMSKPSDEPALIDDNVYSAAISDDDSFIAYTAENSLGESELYLYINGVRVFVDTNVAAAEFSPDSKTLYYIAAQDEYGGGTLKSVELKLSSRALTPKMLDTEVIELHPMGDRQVLYKKLVDAKTQVCELKLYRSSKATSVDSGVITVY